MRTACVLFALILATLWVGCTGTPTEPVPRGAFAYTSYDTIGVALVTGWFTMDVSDSSTITGEWHLRPVGSPESVGPQTGDGILLGGFAEGAVWLELHPQVVDNNLQLRGVLEGDRYAGDWIWTSFIGITNHGTFWAQRRRQ
jgi:hypothetical protein